MPALTVQQVMDGAFACLRLGRRAEAEALLRKVLAADPRHAEALHQLGLLAQEAGALATAEELIGKAVAAAPAVAAYRSNLGNVLQMQGRFDEAIASFRRAIELQPGIAMIHNNLANALRKAGRLDEAIESFHRAVALDPGLAVAWTNLGDALREAGRAGESIAALERALALGLEIPETHNNLGSALLELKRAHEAEAAFRRALDLAPSYALARVNLGNALAAQQRLDEAISQFRLAIEGEPALALAHNNLGCALQERHEMRDAVAAHRRAVQLSPENPSFQNNLGRALLQFFGHDEALACYRRALASEAIPAVMHSSILASLHYCPGVTPAALLDAHRGFDRSHAAALRAGWRAHENDRDPDRPLRLGFVSPHFALHPVGHFLIRPLESLNRAQFEIVCYSDTPRKDRMTGRIAAAATHWRESAAWTDAELAQRIREDRVDILFDLAGHTPGHRLLAFARKPAPIQITWLDYVGTTGLEAIDCIIGDPREIPPGAEPAHRERVLRMPDDYICFDPPGDAPPVAPLPALANGRVTFGSFNILQKITAEAIAVWARILRRVPGSRLLLKNRGLDDASVAARCHELFAAHGIAAGRVELRGWSPQAELLAAYHEIDVALDTFPYNGGLTTCEALWMGVPVVTCPGETFASRHGLAHLTAAGVPETIARDFDEYESLAVSLAGNLPRLAALRSGLRERVAASTLCDGRKFATHFARLLREAWQQWCSRA